MICFGDTYFYLAFVNQRDPANSKAVEFILQHTPQIVTTAWVLTEVADGLARSQRKQFGALLDSLRTDSGTEIVPPSSRLFDDGVELYLSRQDKGWPLTDCISFVVMEERGLTDALTADRHFEQAGFRLLL